MTYRRHLDNGSQTVNGETQHHRHDMRHDAPEEAVLVLEGRIDDVVTVNGDAVQPGEAGDGAISAYTPTCYQIYIASVSLRHLRQVRTHLQWLKPLAFQYSSPIKAPHRYQALRKQQRKPCC